MDFVTHLPSSFGHSVIWVVCDRLTKFVHFVALPTHFTAQDLERRFSIEICRLHGVPKSIVSDRDPLFLSAFWKELFRVQGTTLKYSTAYHPETDGQTEVVNRSLETYLRCFTSNLPRMWFKFLHLAEYWHNSTFHSSISMTPFEALYGRAPPATKDYIQGNASIPSLDSALLNRQTIINTLKHNLVRSQKLMAVQANKKRRDVTFAVGDFAWLRLQPYRQTSVQRRTSQKLSKRFFGPFRILRRIGPIAYELQLPSSSRIHPVFHVSQLRAYHGSDPQRDMVPIPDYIREDVLVESSKEDLEFTTSDVQKESSEIEQSTHVGSKRSENQNSRSNSPIYGTASPSSLLSPSSPSKLIPPVTKPSPPSIHIGSSSNPVSSFQLPTPRDYSNPLLKLNNGHQLYPTSLKPHVSAPGFSKTTSSPFNAQQNRDPLNPSPPSDSQRPSVLSSPHATYPSSGPKTPSSYSANCSPLVYPSVSEIPLTCSPLRPQIFPSGPLNSDQGPISFTPNLEDKVFSGPDSNVRALDRSRRVTKRPIWQQDFILE
ncbi:uncharacterized protein LOC131659393 [Vicia villosa]|uniref:uncharacterized protein LOC131659393 n=1 Tax=Vicia villosa TaxID=3911 RepID=UPI00273AE975|nr:uncharacterized protein LOC131659393 [Vicia villosa]